VAARLLALFVTAATFIGSTAFVLAHPKNDAAPLQPPTATSAAAPASMLPTPTPRTTPRITLQPGVRPTELPGITYTHVS
jgi:hypothetical protein